MSKPQSPMPDRILRDGILSSDRVQKIANAPAVEITFLRLLAVVDDSGRFSGDPQLLRESIYPLHLGMYTDADIAGHLKQCESAGLLRLRDVAGKPYLELLDFDEYLLMEVGDQDEYGAVVVEHGCARNEALMD